MGPRAIVDRRETIGGRLGEPARDVFDPPIPPPTFFLPLRRPAGRVQTSADHRCIIAEMSTRRPPRGEVGGMGERSEKNGT
jgi:hypothetical protein